jgi:hypothetical protein
VSREVVGGYGGGVAMCDVSDEPCEDLALPKSLKQSTWNAHQRYIYRKIHIPHSQASIDVHCTQPVPPPHTHTSKQALVCTAYSSPGMDNVDVAPVACSDTRETGPLVRSLSAMVQSWLTRVMVTECQSPSLTAMDDNMLPSVFASSRN